jgi:hypothetical protein
VIRDLGVDRLLYLVLVLRALAPAPKGDGSQRNDDRADSRGSYLYCSRIE